MQDSMKNEINERYHEILKKLNTNWKLKSKSKHEELIRQGLNMSGVGINSMYNLIEEVIFNSINDLDNMIKDISNEFNDKIPFRELKKHIYKFENTINDYIDCMDKDIHEISEKLTDSCESSFKSKISNIKSNAKNKLERIYIKNKNLQKYKKIEWLVIINTGVAIAGLIVEIIGLVKQ